MEEYKWLLIGSLFTITGIMLYFVTSGLRRNGVIVKSHKIESDVDESLIHEIFEFEDQNGILNHSKSILGSPSGLYKKRQNSISTI